METVNAHPIDGYGTDLTILAGSFQGNGTSSPLAANNRTMTGFVWSVARAGVGLYTITLDALHTMPERPMYIGSGSSQGAVLATDWFDSLVIGEYNLTTRSFQIQLHRAGTAQELAATAGNRVNFWLLVRNTTAR